VKKEYRSITNCIPPTSCIRPRIFTWINRRWIRRIRSKWHMFNFQSRQRYVMTWRRQRSRESRRWKMYSGNREQHITKHITWTLSKGLKLKRQTQALLVPKPDTIHKLRMSSWISSSSQTWHRPSISTWVLGRSLSYPNWTPNRFFLHNLFSQLK